MRVISWFVTVIGAMWTTGNCVLLMAAFAMFSWTHANAEGGLITRAAAGAAFGTILERWSMVLILPMLITTCALGWCGILAWRAKRRGRAIAFALAVSLVVITHMTCQQVGTTVNEMSAKIRFLRLQPGADPQELATKEQRFAEFHGASMMLFSFETLVALGLLVGGSIAVLRQPRAASVPASGT